MYVPLARGGEQWQRKKMDGKLKKFQNFQNNAANMVEISAQQSFQDWIVKLYLHKTSIGYTVHFEHHLSKIRLIPMLVILT